MDRVMITISSEQILRLAYVPQKAKLSGKLKQRSWKSVCGLLKTRCPEVMYAGRRVVDGRPLFDLTFNSEADKELFVKNRLQ